MDIFTKVANVWRRVKLPYVKKQGSWREVRHVYNKINGQWKLAFSRPIIGLHAQGLVQTVEPMDKYGVWFNGNQHLTGVARRSYTLGLIDQNGFIFEQVTYDLHADGDTQVALNNAQNFAAKLNGLQQGQLFFMLTFDEPQSNRLLGGLPDAMYSRGVTREIYENIQYRGAFVILGRVGSRPYYQNYIGKKNPAGIADGDPKALIYLNFNVEKNQVIQRGSTPIATFNGEIPSANFISGDALATVVGLTAGVSVNSDSPWLTFTRHGKTLFVPKLPLRQTTNWQDLYNAGVVFGDDTVGVRPTAMATGVLQNKRVTVAGKTYIVRLLKSTTGGKTYVPGDIQSALDLPIGFDSEWNDLFYMITNDPGISSYTRPKISNPYTPTDLGFTPNPSTGPRICPCQEINADLGGTMLSRGNTNSVARLATDRLYNTTSTASAWRPCLELVE